MTHRPRDPGGAGEDDALAAVASFATREEAESAQELLRNAGISSILQADDVGGLVPSTFIGHTVLVSPRELEKAQEVLEGRTGSEIEEGIEIEGTESGEIQEQRAPGEIDPDDELE
jgi:hypothetical protein